MKSWLFVLLIVITNAYTAPLHAQVISDKLGQIERGFWTRPISNRIRLEEGTLEIHREYRTIVEWSEPGVPFRSVTDTLVWRLPLNSISEVRIYDAPGSVLLEGGDQDTYCPLSVAEFTCSAPDLDCDAQPKFFTCRYNKDELLQLINTLQSNAYWTLKVD